MSQTLNTNPCDDGDDDNHNHNTNTFVSQQRINLLNHSPSSLNSVILQSSPSSQQQQQPQQHQDDKYLNPSIDVNKFLPCEGTDWAKSKQQHNNNNLQQDNSIHQPLSTTWTTTTTMLNTINSQQQMQYQQSSFANNINDIHNHHINTLNIIDNYNSSLPFPDQNIDTDKYYHRALHGIPNHDDLMNHFDYNNNNNYTIDNNNYYHHHHQQSKVQNAPMRQQQQQPALAIAAANGSIITLLPPSRDQKEGKEEDANDNDIDVGINDDDDIDAGINDYGNNIYNNNAIKIPFRDDNDDIPTTASNINNTIQKIPFPATQEELPSYHDKTWRTSYAHHNSTCLYCLKDMKTSAKPHLALHYAYFDSNKPYKCHKCHFGYQHNRYLTHHNNQHHGCDDGDDDNTNNNNKAIQILFRDDHNVENVDNDNNAFDAGNNDNLDNDDIPTTASNINGTIQQIPFPATQEELLSGHDKTWRIRQDVSYVYTCLYCLNHFKGSPQDHIALHSNYFDSNKPYKCHECHLGYESQTHLTQHNIQHHGGSVEHTSDDEDGETPTQIPFPATQEELPTSHLNKTWKIRRSDGVGVCLYCLQTMQTHIPEHLKHHYGYFDSKKLYKCHKCHLGYESKGALTRHNNQNHGRGGGDDIQQIPFPATKEELPTSHYDRTWKSIHDGKYTCHYCLNFITNLQSHLASHHGYFDSKKPYKCHKCYFGYGNKAHFTRHNNEQHGGSVEYTSDNEDEDDDEEEEEDDNEQDDDAEEKDEDGRQDITHQDDDDHSNNIPTQILFPKNSQKLPANCDDTTWYTCTDDGMCICRYCLQSYPNHNSLSQHLKHHYGYFDSNKPHKCYKCYLGYPTAWHLVVHNGVKHIDSDEDEEDDDDDDDDNDDDDDVNAMDEQIDFQHSQQNMSLSLRNKFNKAGSDDDADDGENDDGYNNNNQYEYDMTNSNMIKLNNMKNTDTHTIASNRRGLNSCHHQAVTTNPNNNNNVNQQLTNAQTSLNPSTSTNNTLLPTNNNNNDNIISQLVLPAPSLSLLKNVFPNINNANEKDNINHHTKKNNNHNPTHGHNTIQIPFRDDHNLDSNNDSDAGDLGGDDNDTGDIPTTASNVDNAIQQIPFPKTQEELPTSHLNKTWRIIQDGKSTCAYCLKGIGRDAMNHLTSHRAYFDSNKPYKCHKCHLGYQVLRALTQHNNQHHGGCDNDIQQIPFPATQEELPTSHLDKTWISRKDGNVMCLYCLNFITYHPSHLASHHGYFDSKKPYKCDKCHLGYESKGALTQHNNQHHGRGGGDDIQQIPFPKTKEEMPTSYYGRTWISRKDGNDTCLYCLNLIVNLPSHLAVHRAYFDSKKPYKCHKCHVGYGNKTNLTQHNKQHHGGSVKHTSDNEHEDDGKEEENDGNEEDDDAEEKDEDGRQDITHQDDDNDNNNIPTQILFPKNSQQLLSINYDGDDIIDDVVNNVNAIDEQLPFQHSQQNMSLSLRNKFNKAGSDDDDDDDDGYGRTTTTTTTTIIKNKQTNKNNTLDININMGINDTSSIVENDLNSDEKDDTRTNSNSNNNNNNKNELSLLQQIIRQTETNINNSLSKDDYNIQSSFLTQYIHDPNKRNYFDKIRGTTILYKIKQQQNNITKIKNVSSSLSSSSSLLLSSQIETIPTQYVCEDCFCCYLDFKQHNKQHIDYDNILNNIQQQIDNNNNNNNNNISNKILNILQLSCHHCELLFKQQDDYITHHHIQCPRRFGLTRNENNFEQVIFVMLFLQTKYQIYIPKDYIKNINNNDFIQYHIFQIIPKCFDNHNINQLLKGGNNDDNNNNNDFIKQFQTTSNNIKSTRTTTDKLRTDELTTTITTSSPSKTRQTRLQIQRIPQQSMQTTTTPPSSSSKVLLSSSSLQQHAQVAVTDTNTHTNKSLLNNNSSQNVTQLVNIIQTKQEKQQDTSNTTTTGLINVAVNNQSDNNNNNVDYHHLKELVELKEELKMINQLHHQEIQNNRQYYQQHLLEKDQHYQREMQAKNEHITMLLQLLLGDDNIKK